MNQRLASLSETELRNLLIEESKKFNAAIKFGSPASDLEEILTEIKDIEDLITQKEIGEIPHAAVESIPPHRGARHR